MDVSEVRNEVGIARAEVGGDDGSCAERGLEHLQDREIEVVAAVEEDEIDRPRKSCKRLQGVAGADLDEVVEARGGEVAGRGCRLAREDSVVTSEPPPASRSAAASAIVEIPCEAPNSTTRVGSRMRVRR